MVTCRVCQGMIDITSKRDQHVVKCLQCNEATVSYITIAGEIMQKLFLILYFSLYVMHHQAKNTYVAHAIVCLFVKVHLNVLLVHDLIASVL